MGMTAQEFRIRRLRDQARTRGAERGESNGQILRDYTVLKDFGSGDPSGNADVWTPPMSGYRFERNENQRGVRHAWGNARHKPWARYDLR